MLALLALAARASWPRDRRTLGHLAVAGLLLQAVQFSAGYLGMAAGVPAALAALIMCSCPLVVAIAGSERLGLGAWAGLLLGFGGVVLALADRISGGGSAGGVAITVVGLGGFAAGTLHQRHVPAAVDLRAGAAIQLGVAAVAVAPIALLHGGLAMPATTEALGSLAWLALANSVGGMTLLLWLLRRGSTTATTSLLYLVPPVTALLAVPLLGQHLDPPVLAALGVSAAGVALTTRATAGRGLRLPLPYRRSSGSSAPSAPARAPRAPAGGRRAAPRARSP